MPIISTDFSHYSVLSLPFGKGEWKYQMISYSAKTKGTVQTFKKIRQWLCLRQEGHVISSGVDHCLAGEGKKNPEPKSLPILRFNPCSGLDYVNSNWKLLDPLGLNYHLLQDAISQWTNIMRLGEQLILLLALLYLLKQQRRFQTLQPSAYNLSPDCNSLTQQENRYMKCLLPDFFLQISVLFLKQNKAETFLWLRWTKCYLVTKTDSSIPGHRHHKVGIKGAAFVRKIIITFTT